MDSESAVHPDPLSGHAWDEMLLRDGPTKRKSCVGIQEPEPHPDQDKEEACQDPRSAVSQELRARCLQLGMTSEALDGWAQYHVRPAVAMAYHLSAQILILGTTGYLFTGAPFSRFFYSIPYMCGTLLQVGHLTVAWRYGPGQGLTLNPLVRRTFPGTAPPSPSSLLLHCF